MSCARPSLTVWTNVAATAFRAPVESGELFWWLPLGRIGIFAFRLTAIDQANHESKSIVTVNVLAPMKRKDGGLSSSSDGEASLYVPPNSLPQDTIITINPVPEDRIQPHPNNLGIAYDLAPADRQFNKIKPATLTISYRGGHTRRETGHDLQVRNGCMEGAWWRRRR